MHAQGNYTNQSGSNGYAPGPAFQQRPPATTLPLPPPPPLPYHRPFAPQPQPIQQGRPSFHPTPGVSSYQHAPPSVPHQGPPAPVVSSGTSSAQSYLSNTQSPQVHVNNQISNSYQTSEQHVRWNENVHPLPPRVPPPGSSAYPQGQSGPLRQYPPQPLPPYSSSSSFFMSDPFGSSALATCQHSYLQSMGPLPPPPPPPPPSSTPPRVPPLPPSSPASNVCIKNDVSLFNGDNLMVEHSSPAKLAEDRNEHQNEVPCHQSENSGPELESMDAAVANSPADSDMEMEDDITHPDEEKKGRLSTNSNDGCTSISPEDYGKEQLQDLKHTGEPIVPVDALHENLLFAEASVLKDQRGAGSEEVSHCDSPVTMKVFSEADEPGMTKNGQTEQALEASVKKSFSEHENFSQPSVPVVYEETCNRDLSGQLMEGANAFNLLQGYASDNILENEVENNLGDVSSPARNGGSTDFDAQKGCNFRSKVRVESLSESNEHMFPKSMIESPRNVIEADKSSLGTGSHEGFSNKSRRGQEYATTYAALQSKDPSWSYDACIGLEGVKFHKQEMKSNPTEMKVDEFGRLVREGASDSDPSDSPRYTRRHARRARKRSRSRSRSRSPHERRRRSPWRRKGRRGRSRSLSPRRRRSRSRSPVLRRDTEYSGDRQKREKTKLPECFDFLRGKCYRGATCRYSHHETEKSERLRYSRGKQQSTLRSSDVHEEGKVFYEKEVQDKGSPQDIPGLREVRDAKELPVDKINSLVPSSLPVSDVVASNLSGYSAHDIPLGKEDSLILESPTHYYDKMPQTFDQQGPVSESSLLVQASEATSVHLPADKPDAEHGPTRQLSVESPKTKPSSTEEARFQSSQVLLVSVGNHSSEVTLTSPSVSQVMSAPYGQDNNLLPPIAQFHLTKENHSPYQAPVPYQHSRFPGPSNSSSSPSLPPPPPLPPPRHLAVNATLGEHGNPSQHTQPSLQPPRDGLSSYTSRRAQPTELPNRSQTSQYQVYPLPREPDQMLHITENTASNSLQVSNPSNLQTGPRILGEHVTGYPVQGMNPLNPFSQAQPYSLTVNSPSKATHTNLGGSRSLNSYSSHGHPYFQQASYGLQYSAAGGVPTQFSQPETMSSSMARTTPDFLERNQPSYVHNFVGSSIANHFNPYASTFDLPLSSKFKLNASIQENGTNINTNYGVPVGSSSVPVDVHNMIPSSSSGLPAQSVLPRVGGDQYDPLFDSIEPASTSFSRADHKKHETPGDSDNILGFSGALRVLNDEMIKQEGETALSANDSIDNEEFGETADAEVGAVLNGSPSSADDETNMNAGEIEIDQVKASRKQRKGKESRSMKLFKSSVATFVKEVLKPSWRQGNMSKEAFKTIVKKTVDKVSGAMKGHHVPKSQAKINHYIDSSRGKLTKLVMGYVDKYVKA